MDKYARSLAGQGQKISPEDSDYKEKLIHVVQSFRTFDVALDDFILHHGYTGELSDIDGKIRFIKGKFNIIYSKNFSFLYRWEMNCIKTKRTLVPQCEPWYNRISR